MLPARVHEAGRCLYSLPPDSVYSYITLQILTSPTTFWQVRKVGEGGRGQICRVKQSSAEPWSPYLKPSSTLCWINRGVNTMEKIKMGLKGKICWCWMEFAGVLHIPEDYINSLWSHCWPPGSHAPKFNIEQIVTPLSQFHQTWYSSLPAKPPSAQLA